MSISLPVLKPFDERELAGDIKFPAAAVEKMKNIFACSQGCSYKVASYPDHTIEK